MENKNVGYLILGISALIIFIIFLFSNAMKEIISQACPLVELEHGIGVCPAYGTINQQTYLSFGIVGLLIIVGLFLVFSKPNEKIIIKEEGMKKIKIDISDLKSEEKQVFEIIQKNKAIFQADLIEKTGLGKAKITRIIDRLEGKGLVERKRRGMTNVVVLKE
ncbi:MarR family transcriptional regulator [Candidatus Pacearchaeota archaeon]|nr:MarR family transcriptional regulator [Candidatus Pacearchaeota archaeon]